MNKTITDGMLTELREKIKPYLTEKRYAHTLSVEDEAAALGNIYCPDKINKLRASALLHDITKNLPLEKQLKYCMEFDIIISPLNELSAKIFHQATAAEIAKRDFSDYTDDEIISGIRYHTTGRPGMTVFESIIFLADYIEKTRTFEDCIVLRDYFYSRLPGTANLAEKLALLDNTMIYAFDMTIKDLINNGALINDNTVCARNFFVEKNHKAENELEIEK